MNMSKQWLAALVLILSVSTAEAQGRGGAEMLAAMDANADGALSRAEAQAARATLFSRLDRDGNGALSQDEREAAQANRGAAQLINGADTNRDGVTTRVEAMARPYRAFDIFDRNRDDILDSGELDAIRALRPGG
jgi:Ca2+-binding EF-hand superfamily protein